MGTTSRLRIATVVGARPQFVKAAALRDALRGVHTEFLIHTGQHYDWRMSGVFFEELDLGEPYANLGVGSGTHGQQTGSMLLRLERLLRELKLDWVVTYGDTNSTLAAALAASQLGLPSAHVEAGLRSRRRDMPEEMNRIVADHLATAHLCPSELAVANLTAEGLSRNAHFVGDVMFYALSKALRRLGPVRDVPSQFGLRAGHYILASVHRVENVTNPERLGGIVNGLNASGKRILFPAHPRTKDALEKFRLSLAPNVTLTCPVGYLDMLRLEQAAEAVVTDSGGVQKEAFWLRRPCITLRTETEWPETVASQWNRLVGSDTEAIVAALISIETPAFRPSVYGDESAPARCVAVIENLS